MDSQAGRPYKEHPNTMAMAEDTDTVNMADYMYLINHLELYVDLYIWKNQKLRQVRILQVSYCNPSNYMC